jgi:hypothetical protein
MEIDVFVVCDAATVSAGKLNIIGVFDTIWSPIAPMTRRDLSIALRMRFGKEEFGPKKLRIAIVGDGEKEVIPPLDASIQVRAPAHPQARFATAQIVLGLRSLKLTRFGEYRIDLLLDGKLQRSLPLFVRQRFPAPRPSQTADEPES